MITDAAEVSILRRYIRGETAHLISSMQLWYITISNLYRRRHVLDYASDKPFTTLLLTW